MELRERDIRVRILGKMENGLLSSGDITPDKAYSLYLELKNTEGLDFGDLGKEYIWKKVVPFEVFKDVQIWDMFSLKIYSPDGKTWSVSKERAEQSDMKNSGGVEIRANLHFKE